ncbi:MAG: adenylosuccinate lyase [Chitinophagales bacterium]
MPSTLTAISPIDGRYRNKVESLGQYFSEYALIKYRVKVEVEYLILLATAIPQIETFDKDSQAQLRKLYIDFTEEDAAAIKEIEKTTNHDVKAVEYFIKNKIKDFVPAAALEFVHFGLTSQDINNTATPLLLKDAHFDVILPTINSVIEKLKELEMEYKDITLLAKTHGQPASPTILGKEIRVFTERIEKQLELLKTIPFSAKFGGATGNFNAHLVAYPNQDWIAFGNTFVNEVLSLDRSQTTTQIEHYDNLAALFHNYARINTILMDLCKDVWTYISMDYFKQKLKEGEVGSSAMPHKVNPIDFENAEGNLGLANALYEHLASKLPISRLQRDLTDSTVLRNIGVPVAHTLIALSSIQKGLGKLIINEAAIKADLDKNWAVVAEAIQTVLRREGFEKPYEALKGLTRTNDVINEAKILAFIETLAVSEEIKAELKKISPFNYRGYA